jgi:glycosyltransferase involved in cell wall biosynthesis
MNIIQINSFITLNGGSETVMSNLTELLEYQGHNVKNLGFTSLKEERLMAHTQSLGKEKYNLKTFFSDNKTVDLIIDLIKQENIGLVICHNVYHKYPIAALFKAIKQRTRAKLLLVFHDFKAVCPRASLYNGKNFCTKCKNGKFYNVIKYRCRHNSLVQSTVLALDSYYNNSLRHAYTYPDYFISPSKFLAQQYNNMGFVRNIHVINNPINIFENIRTKNTSSFTNTILYAGRFSKDKGIEIFLYAASQFNNIKFLIAGSGDLIEKVTEAGRIMPNVEYLGNLNKENLIKAFDRSDYLIVPSIAIENNPMIIIEAMTFGLPVLGSRIGGIPELLDENRGFLFDPHNTETLIHAIHEAISLSLQEYQTLSEKIKEFSQSLSYDNYYGKLIVAVPELLIKNEK